MWYILLIIINFVINFIYYNIYVCNDYRKYLSIYIYIRVLDWMGQTGPGEGAQVHEDNGVKFESILRYFFLNLKIIMIQ